MTAPAIPAPTTQAAPTPEITQEGRWGVDDALASITQSAVQQTIADTTPAADNAERPRDEKGRFAKQETSEETQPPAEQTAQDNGAPSTETPTEGTETAQEAALELPEGFVAVPSIAQANRQPATVFKVLDAEGELEAPDILIEFPANGKTRKEPLDKVVKLAQFGVYNEERQQQIAQVQQQAESTAQQNQQLTQLIQQYQQERERLLSDDNAYLAARAQFHQQNTPEAIAQRAQQQTAQQQQKLAFDTAAFQGQQFLASELEPAVDQIAKALPTISAEEIGARLLLVTDRYRVHTPFGSLIPPAAYPAVRQAILTDVVPWAQQVHDYRQNERQTTATATDQKTTAQIRDLEKERDSARVEAQKAKNLVGRVAKGAPASAGKAAPDAPPKKPIRTVDDAEQAAIQDAIAATLAG